MLSRTMYTRGPERAKLESFSRKQREAMERARTARRICAVLIILGALAIAGVWRISTAFADTYRCMVDSGESLNVRSAPSKKARTDGRRLFSGSKIEGTWTEDHKWVAFVQDGETVYAMSRYLELQCEEECTVIGGGRLRWRKTPGGKVSGYLQPGDDVVVYGIVADSSGNLWARVAESKWAIGGKYVSLAFLATADGRTLDERYK